MGEAGDLEDLLRAAGVVARPSLVVPLAGGDIADVRRVELENGETVVVKLGRVGANGGVASDPGRKAREESSGLQAIAVTTTLPTPAVLGIATLGNRSALVLEDLGDPASVGDADWVEFGRRLADLHAGDVVAFGFDHSNHLGHTPQDNRPVEPDDWAIFLRDRRLLPMREALERLGRADATDLADLDRLADRLEDLLPRGIRPGLLHGDLWSGNVHPTRDRGIAVLDPAVFRGDPLFELGMMRLFGGFPSACEAAYRERLVEHRGDEALESAELRVELGRLHHLLNHWLLFGDGYAAECRRSLGGLSRSATRSRP